MAYKEPNLGNEGGKALYDALTKMNDDITKKSTKKKPKKKTTKK